MKVFVFKTGKGNFGLEYGYNLLENKLSYVGIPVELSDESGHVDLFSLENGRKVMITSSIMKKEMFVGEPKNAPVKVETPHGTVSASCMVVYTTKNGSQYAFIPTDVTPVLL
jgi:hypothetical protein